MSKETLTETSEGKFAKIWVTMRNWQWGQSIKC